jgi:murein L,D-transpeptidase YcbB/YkuD
MGRTVKGNAETPVLELLLTSAYFAYAKLAWEGMPPSVSKAGKWYLPRKKVDYNQYLDSLLSTPKGESSAKDPVYRQYELLRGFLGKYRQLEAREVWLPIAQGKRKLSPEDTSFLIPPIKRRLFLLGYYQGDTASQVYDLGLSAAVKTFQKSHGLQTDGLPGKEPWLSSILPWERGSGKYW